MYNFWRKYSIYFLKLSNKYQIPIVVYNVAQSHLIIVAVDKYKYWVKVICVCFVDSHTSLCCQTTWFTSHTSQSQPVPVEIQSVHLRPLVFRTATQLFTNAKVHTLRIKLEMCTNSVLLWILSILEWYIITLVNLDMSELNFLLTEW